MKDLLTSLLGAIVLGAWGLQAADAGAASVTCVDSSPKAVEAIGDPGDRLPQGVFHPTVAKLTR